MHLYLTGYRGCGKTSVARAVAEQLGVDAIDLDQVIVQTTGCTIPEIFAAEGEAGFRDHESAALAHIAQFAASTPSVVALGGGAILRDANRLRIGQTGRCVWLVAQPATLAVRIAADESTGPQRPSLTGRSPEEEVTEVLESRKHLYTSVADHCIDVDRQSIEDIAEQILTWLDSELA